MNEEILVDDLQPTTDNRQPATEPALPEGEVLAPPRPLVAGAFLGGEYEIKELLARGPVNFYGASGFFKLQNADDFLSAIEQRNISEMLF